MSARLEWNGDIVDARIHEAAADGLNDAGEHLVGVSRSRAPHEEGILELSGTWSPDREALRGVVSFDTPYAVYQHEVLDLQHDPGRTAKYLEEPAHEEMAAMTELVAARIRRALT